MSVRERAAVERFREILVARLGLTFEDTRADDVAECLRARVAAAGGEGRIDDYLEHLAHGSARDELRAIAERLTVGETYFFRNPNHFHALADRLCDRIAAEGASGGLRILSAGCASGEEAYTIAMTLRARLPLAALAGVRIVGIDVNGTLVEKARAGRYQAWSMRATPPAAQERWFEKEGRDFVLHREVRDMASFEERNLCPEDFAFWAPGAFDVIFCRNVLIYFSPDPLREVVARFARALGPGGLLFLGDAENLRGVSHDFHLHHTHETFYYGVRREGTALSSSPLVFSAPLPSVTHAPPPDTSWVEAIQKASDRLAQLVPASGPAPASEPVAAAPRSSVLSVAVAMSLLERERYTEAIAALQGLPAEAESDPDVQLLRASLLIAAGDAAGAAAACERVLALDEFNAGAHYVQALCREHAGDVEDALRHDQTAAYLDPAFAMARLHLGRLERRRGHASVARAELTRALDLLSREDASRLLLFGGGFGREALLQVCRAEIAACGGAR